MSNRFEWGARSSPWWLSRGSAYPGARSPSPGLLTSHAFFLKGYLTGPIFSSGWAVRWRFRLGKKWWLCRLVSQNSPTRFCWKSPLDWVVVLCLRWRWGRPTRVAAGLYRRQWRSLVKCRSTVRRPHSGQWLSTHDDWALHDPRHGRRRRFFSEAYVHTLDTLSSV